MIIRLLVCLGMIGIATQAVAAENKLFKFAYVHRQGDPAFETKRAYTGQVLKDLKPARDAVHLAVRDARIPGRAAGVQFALDDILVPAGEDIVAAIRQAGVHDINVFVMDVPRDDLMAAAAALDTDNVLLINARHRHNSLRSAACSRVVLHTLPSERMLTDALAQFLRKKNWTQVLVLAGDTREDKRMSAVFRVSAKKFALKIVDERMFVLSNDPRQRDQNNIALLTQGDYDAVFLADSIGEYGRYVPFQTQLARPVVGSEGLIASAWHWTFERYGAPQLNQRFIKRAERRMDPKDWAAWAGVTSIVTAILRTGSTELEKFRNFVFSDPFILDGYKGSPLSFRRWNNQLRQPILLHTHNAVVALTPLEGYLHEHNVLDTLGLDKPESACAF